MNIQQAVVVAAVVVMGFGAWLWQHDKTVAARALAQARGDSVQAALERGDSIVAYRDSVDAEKEEEKLLLRDSLVLAKVTMRDLRAATEAVDTVRLIMESSDSIPAELVEEAIGHLEQQVEVCDAALGNCEDIIQIQANQLLARDSSITTLLHDREHLSGLYEEANNAAHPGFFRRLEQSVPFVAVATVLGLIIGIVFGG
jgi:hypothetical protein